MWYISLWILGYLLVFYGPLFAFLAYHRFRSKVRPPLTEKLKRPAGYTLDRKLRKIDEFDGLIVCLYAFLPPIIGWLLFWTPLKLGWVKTWPVAWALLGVAVIVTGLCLFLSGRRFLRGMLRYRNDNLGLYGERIVGEALQPLYREGYEIFHDIPATGRNGKSFNLDHVTVGSTGVCLIETKTRRKGRTVAGCKDHEVIFDGRQLIWPWGEDRHGLDQAAANAEWLEKWIFGKEGFRLKVLPILTIPGWWTVERMLGPVRVANQKLLPSYIRKQRNCALTEEQVARISRRLDELVRDVD